MEDTNTNEDIVKLVDGSKSKHDSGPMQCRKVAIYCLWGVAQIFLLCYCISSLSLISIDNTVAAVDFAIVLLMIVGIILFVGGTLNTFHLAYLYFHLLQALGLVRLERRATP